MRLLIVDDSDIVRKSLTALLSQMKDIEVVGVARNAYEAIKIFEQLRPDTAIVDILMPGGEQMPDANGIDVLRHLKNEKDAPLVIMYTSYPYPPYRKKCMEEGADFFFDKTLDLHKLIDVIIELSTAKLTHA